jgi:hypothetical protein
LIRRGRKSLKQNRKSERERKKKKNIPGQPDFSVSVTPKLPVFSSFMPGQFVFETKN